MTVVSDIDSLFTTTIVTENLTTQTMSFGRLHSIPITLYLH